MTVLWIHIWPRLLVVSLLVLLVLGTLRLFERRNLYYPTRMIEQVPSDIGLSYEDIHFVAEDDCKLHGWWIPHEEARGTILMCHGNAGNISGRVWMAGDLHRLGVNVFLFDYRGFGKSSGFASEKGLYRDARAAYEVVRARYDNAEDPPILIYGRSLGGAVAIDLAQKKSIKGLIIESTFTSAVAVGEKLYPRLPIRWFCHDRYDSLSKMNSITVPLLMAHSPDDQLIPYEMGQALFEQAASPVKTFCRISGGHNDSGWTGKDPYWLQIEGFVKTSLAIKETF